MSLEYFIDSSIQESENDKWMLLFDLYSKKAKYIEFNVRSINGDFKKILSQFNNDIVSMGEIKNRIHSGGNSIRFETSKEIIAFVKSKEYSFWNKFCISDISLYENDKEVLACNSHDAVIYILATEETIENLNNKGFRFEKR
jgi:hypothetical protein